MKAFGMVHRSIVFIESLLLPRLLRSAGEGIVNKSTLITFNDPYEAQYETHSLSFGLAGLAGIMTVP